MNLAASTWTDVDALDTDLAVLPVGSTEQHGPHAPLSTDTITAETVAEAGVEEYDGDVVVAPTIPYGVSAEHRQFTGTLWFSPDTFRDAVRDVIDSLSSHGWNRVVLVNGHGGNSDALREVAAEVSRGGETYVAVFTWFDAIDIADMGHAGAVETSMVCHADPDLVHDDRMEEASGDAADGWGEWVAGVNLAFDTAAFSENGVVGDPAGGYAGRGRALTERLGETLSELFDAVSERDISPPQHK